MLSTVLTGLSLVVAIPLTAAITNHCPVLQACCEEECRNVYNGVVTNQCACAYGCIYSYHEDPSGGHNTLCDSRSDDDGECHVGSRGAYCEGIVGSDCSKCNGFDPWVGKLSGGCEDIVCDVKSASYVDTTGGDRLDCQCECESPCQAGARLQAKCKSHINTDAFTSFTESSRFYDKVYVMKGKMLGVCGLDVQFGGNRLDSIVDSSILQEKYEKVDQYSKSSKKNEDVCGTVQKYITLGYDSAVPGWAQSSKLKGVLNKIHDVNKKIREGEKAANDVAGWIFDGPLGNVVDAVKKGVGMVDNGASAASSLGSTVLKWGVNTGLAAFGLPRACSKHATVHAGWMEKAGEELFKTIAAGAAHGKVFPKDSYGEKSASNGRCISYPQKATTCRSLGHSHNVFSIFEDDDVVSRTNSAIEIAWERMMKSDAMKRLADSHMTCKWSLKDAFCIEAFPPCDPTDLTPCQIICRNSIGCFEEAFPAVRKDLGTEKYQQDITDKCHKMCSESMKKHIPTSRLWNVVPMPSFVHASPAALTLFLFAILGTFMALGFARWSGGVSHRMRKAVPTESVDDDDGYE